MTDFLDSEGRVIHEHVAPDGTYVDSYVGRHINPGHGIECMWFIMDAAAERGDADTAARAAEAIKWCLDFGWDQDCGGIYYFMDKMARPHIELQWDMKLWWPHLEALIAVLLAYKITGDREFFDWFERIHDYAWSVFPDKEQGEWFGYANRRGEINNRCRGNRWKACFHLPRALWLVAELCKDLCTTEDAEGVIQ